MLTNIVASIVVSLVTNVTERVPTHWENGPRPPGYETLAVMIGSEVPDPDPKQKWVRTVIKRVTTLSFDFEGQHYSVDKEQIVSDKEVEYRLERIDNWKTYGENAQTPGAWSSTNSVNYTK